MRGTWQTEGGGVDAGSLAAVAVAVLAFMVLGDVAAAVAHLIVLALVTLAVVAVLAAAGMIVLVVHRVRHPLAALPLARARAVPGEPPGMLPPQRRELEAPRQVHVHFHGMDADAVARALRDARIGE